MDQHEGSNGESSCIYDGISKVPKDITFIVVKEGVKVIESDAFRKCIKLKSIEIPSSVQSISLMAFEGCISLVSVKLPPSLTHILSWAFSGCTSLSIINFPPSLVHIGFGAFSSCSSLKSIDLPSSLTEFEDAFKGCSSITSIQLPSTLEEIAPRSFKGSKALAHLKLPSSLTHIGKGAFEECTSLIDIDLPESLTHIGDNAFQGCTSLSKITFPPVITDIGDSAFKGCSSISSVIVPASITNIGKNAFEGCKSLENIDLSSATNISQIQTDTFANCSSLSSIDLPATIQSVANGAFKECQSLHMIKLPSSLTHIGQNAFKSCVFLSSIHLPDSITHIQNGTFKDCTSLKSVHLPASLTHIGHHAFSSCTSLPVIALPPSITSIESAAFENCKKLAIYEVPPSTSIADDAFIGCSNYNDENDDVPVTDFLKHRFDDLSLHRICFDSDVSTQKLQTYIDEHGCIDVGKVDKMNCTALHILASNPVATSDMIMILVKAHPSITQKRDKLGRLFMHYVCENPNIVLSREILELKAEDGSYLVSKEDDYKDNGTLLAVRSNKKYAAKQLIFGVHPIKEDLKTTSEENECIMNLRRGHLKFLKERGGFSNLSDSERRGTVRFLIDLDDTITIKEWVDYIKNECSIKDLNDLSEFKDEEGRQLTRMKQSPIRIPLLEKILFLGKYQILKEPPMYKSDRTVVLKAIDMNVEASQRNSIIESEYFYDSRYRHECPVAIKFMKCKNNFIREKEIRIKFEENLNDTTKPLLTRVVDIIENYNAETNEAFKAAKNALICENVERLQSFDYAIVMKQGDKNLDMIQRYECPTQERVRHYARHICEAIQEIHSKSYVHGDIKLQNFIRFGSDLKIIGFNATLRKNDCKSDQNYAGLDFSSGTLPPEMLFCINEGNRDGIDRFMNYFQNLRKENKQLWIKIQLKKDDVGNCFSVKTYQINKSTKSVKDIEQLPYPLIQPHESQDLWALGVTLYKLILGKPLFEVDKNEDLLSYAGFSELFFWDNLERNKKLTMIEDDKAKHLLSMLLSEEPKDRGSINAVLEHPFLNPHKELNKEQKKILKHISQCDANQKHMLVSLQNNTHNIIARIENSTAMMFEMMFGVSESNVPLCFLLLNKKLNDQNKESREVIISSFFEGLFNSNDPLVVRSEISKLDELGKFLRGNMNINETHYLYFIDEYSGEPVIDNGTSPVEIVLAECSAIEQILSVMLLGMKFLQDRREGVGKICRETKGSWETLEVFDRISSGKNNHIQSMGLRILKKMIWENAPSNNVYFGLMRVRDVQSNVIWMSPANAEKFKKDNDFLDNFSYTRLEVLEKYKEEVEREKKERTEEIPSIRTEILFSDRDESREERSLFSCLLCFKRKKN